MIFLCTGTPNTLLPRLHLAGTPLRSFYREDLPMDFDLFVPLPVARDADGRRERKWRKTLTKHCSFTYI